jgi:hypothetical protein
LLNALLLAAAALGQKAFPSSSTLEERRIKRNAKKDHANAAAE